MTCLRTSFESLLLHTLAPAVNNDTVPARRPMQQCPPEVFYTIGMYHLQTSDPTQAKQFFQSGAQCTNAPPNPLCTYMLGKIAEQEGDFRMAEKLYVWALETEPVLPSTFVKLLALIDEHHKARKEAVTRKSSTCVH